MRTTGTKIQEKLENFRLRFVGEIAFSILAPIGSYVNESENILTLKKKSIFFFKNAQNVRAHSPGEAKNEFERNMCILGKGIIAIRTDDGRILVL